MGSCEVSVTLRHLDVGVTEQLREFVQITARHHVPGNKGMAQIVEPKVSNLCSLEQFMETLVRTLTPTGAPGSGGKMRSSPMTAGTVGSLLRVQVASEQGVSFLLEPCPNDDQSLAVENVSPFKAKISPCRIPVAMAIRTNRRRRRFARLMSFVPFRYIRSSRATCKWRISASER